MRVARTMRSRGVAVTIRSRGVAVTIRSRGVAVTIRTIRSRGVAVTIRSRGVAVTIRSRGVAVSFDGSGGQRAPTRRHSERGTRRGNGQRGEAQRERHSERGTARQEPGRGRGKGGAGDREGDDAAAGQTHLINNAHKQTRERALHTHTARWMTRRRVSRSDAADE